MHEKMDRRHGDTDPGGSGMDRKKKIDWKFTKKKADKKLST